MSPGATIMLTGALLTLAGTIALAAGIARFYAGRGDTLTGCLSWFGGLIASSGVWVIVVGLIVTLAHPGQR